jgi:hypothetical protein
MKYFNEFSTHCRLVLLLLFVHHTKCLLGLRNRFSRRIRLGFLGLVLLFSSYTPRAFAGATLRDTLICTDDFPSYQIGIQLRDQDVLECEMELPGAFKGDIQEVSWTLHFTENLSPAARAEVAWTSLGKDHSACREDVLISGNTLTVKIYVPTGGAISQAVRARIKVLGLDESGARLRLRMLAGIVIADNINCFTLPVFVDQNDILDAPEGSPHTANGGLENDYGMENAPQGLQVVPNPARDHCRLIGIPVNATQIQILDRQMQVQYKRNISGQIALDLDLSMLLPGNYTVVALTPDGPKFFQLIKQS